MWTDSIEEPFDEYINGQVLLSFKDFIKKRHGQEGLGNLDGKFDFDILKIKDAKEYPIKYAVDFMDYVHETYGPDELYQMGRFSLQNIGTKRYFTLFMAPEKLLEKLVESVPKVNNSIHLDIKYQDKGAVVTLTNKELKEFQCKYWHGMLQGVYDLTKTTGEIEVDSSKVATDKMAIYTMKW